MEVEAGRYEPWVLPWIPCQEEGRKDLPPALRDQCHRTEVGRLPGLRGPGT